MVLKSLFNKFDKDGSGTLRGDEIKSLFQDLGLDESQAEVMSYLADKDGDRTLTKQEFLDLAQKDEIKSSYTNTSRRYQLLSAAIQQFASHDKDGSGSIDSSEFSTLMKSIEVAEDQIPGALASLDSSGDGKIQFDEFLKWLNWLPADQ